MSNIIKKYKLEEWKAIGFKKSGPVLGDAYGIVNAYLKEGDKENAETVANVVGFVLSEVLSKLDDIRIVFDDEETITLFKADLIKEKAIFFEAGAIIAGDE